MALRRNFWAGKLPPKPSSARPRGESAATWPRLRGPRGGIATEPPSLFPDAICRFPDLKSFSLPFWFISGPHDLHSFSSLDPTLPAHCSSLILPLLSVLLPLTRTLNPRTRHPAPSPTRPAPPPPRPTASSQPPHSHLVLDLGFRRIELTQSQPDTSIDETDLYLFVVERDDKGQTYGLGWTPSGRGAHMLLRGAGGGDEARSSRPISSPNEPVELLQRDFQTMQTHILRVMQDHTLTQDQLRDVQGQLRRMEQALMDRLGISFAPAPPRDVPVDHSRGRRHLDD
ncbi:hypothetical protein Scep_022269 [Stephania cephalantha]|uniref:Uncharacterized protein n=1 Tax=Stephania cephalantha TaxID=152367 RepID=A0AAP0F7M3_9MAGN